MLSVGTVQLLSHVWLLATPWIAARQASLSFTISLSLSQWCHPTISSSVTLLLPSIFPSIRVSSSESAFHIKWPKYWSFNFSTSPSSEYSKLLSFRIVFYTSLIQAEFHINCKWKWNYCLSLFHAVFYSFALSLPLFSLLLPSKQYNWFKYN